EHFLFEVGQSKPKFIFVGDEQNWERVGPHAHLFEKAITLEMGSEMTFHDLAKRGAEILKSNPFAYEELERRVHEDDLATIIYTSGSTGMPKGVELTHKNLVSIIHEEDFQWDPLTDVYLNFLPLAHIFAKQLNLIMVAWGIQSYYINDLTKIGMAAQEVRPTFIIAVPRLLEKVYAKMRDKVENSSFLKKAIGKWAFSVAKGSGSLLKPLANLLVFKKLRHALGGNLRLIFSGGAALDPKLHHFFLNIGLPVHQGWGMTEVSTIAVNRFSHNKIGTVGPPLGDAQFKISAEGELLVKGSTVMRGYYQNRAATEQALDEQGWFHTGDRGFIDRDGHLVIEGRMNETFKTAQGEFVSPVQIEQQICQSPFIEMAMCIGEGKPFVACFLFPDWGQVDALKKKHGKQGMSNEEFLNSDVMRGKVCALLEKVNKNLDHWEEVHGYRFIMTAPSIEGGELTPTMKLRRKLILEKYQNLLTEIYSEEAACTGELQS
ncbi:MAG: AMP-binding protein, partial [Chlamydiia bacterium]|nr:AMP-binding protein [Chlamydiia bacterium]